MQKLPKRLHREEWHASHWAMHVLDGNTDEWFLFFPDSEFVTAKYRGQMTRKMANEIAGNLRRAASWLENQFLPSGEAKVIKLERPK